MITVSVVHTHSCFENLRLQ